MEKLQRQYRDFLYSLHIIPLMWIYYIALVHLLLLVDKYWYINVTQTPYIIQNFICS